MRLAKYVMAIFFEEQGGTIFCNKNLRNATDAATSRQQQQIKRLRSKLPSFAVEYNRKQAERPRSFRRFFVTKKSVLSFSKS
jgi:hypothetical protein